MYHCSAAIKIFNQCFKSSINTELVRGGHEPIYIPRSQYYPWDRVIFAHGFFSSALHEISHWCIAGEKRRKLVDFGYWYNPDGRTPEQQTEFEKVEIKPQAIEWAFTEAAGRRFQVSTDNLNGAEPDREGFTKNVAAQLARYKADGFPPRAERFINALENTFCKKKHDDAPGADAA